MLQITILHKEHGNTIQIASIKDKDTGNVLSTFDETEKCTDLTCLIPEVGKEILITHVNEKLDKSVELDYEHVCILQKVDKDQNGVMFMQHTVAEEQPES